MRLTAPGLENDIVRFEPFTEAKKHLLHEPGIVHEMWHWMPKLPGGVGVEQYADYVLARQASGEMAAFNIYRQSDDTFAGVIGLIDINRVNRSVRVGFGWHPPEMHNTAVFPATQALILQRLIDWGMRRVSWYIDTRNTGPCRAVEWLGARREAVCRSLMRLSDGSWSDMIVYSLLRAEARKTIEHMNKVIAGLAPPMVEAQ